MIASWEERFWVNECTLSVRGCTSLTEATSTRKYILLGGSGDALPLGGKSGITMFKHVTFRCCGDKLNSNKLMGAHCIIKVLSTLHTYGSVTLSRRLVKVCRG